MNRNRSGSYTRKVGTKTIEVSTDINSKSSDVINSFWLRLDLLQHGILPMPTECDLNFDSLTLLCNRHRNARALSGQYFKTINFEQALDSTLTFQEWKAIATEDLRLSEVQIEILFERFKTIRAIREGRWRKSENFTGVVYFYEFVLYLALQTVFNTVKVLPKKDSWKQPEFSESKEIKKPKEPRKKLEPSFRRNSESNLQEAKKNCWKRNLRRIEDFKKRVWIFLSLRINQKPIQD